MPVETRSDIVTEAELRRYLRFASVLLGTAEAPSGHGGASDPVRRLDVEQRILVLRRARHWLRTALLDLDRLVHEAESIPDTVDDPLTFIVQALTIGVES